jgi:hypothetical protein
MNNNQKLKQTLDDMGAKLDSFNPQRLKITACGFTELLSADLPIPPPIIEPFLFEADLAMYHGWRGTGKTWFSLSLAYAIAVGGSFLGFKCNNPKRVLYLDGEMVGGRLKKRLAQIGKGFLGTETTEDPTKNLFIVTRDMQNKQVDWADIGTAAGRSDINDLIARHDAQVVVLDNLSAWQRTGGKENDAESWNEVAGWLLHLRSQGVAVVIIHHQGKNGLQRGTSKKEDILDTIIGLKRPPDYDPSDGLRVCLEFEKARNLDGSEIPSVEVSLKVADGVATFDVIKTQSDPISVVHALIDDGATRGEIQNALGMDRFQLKRLEERSVKLGRPFKLPDARAAKKSVDRGYSNAKGRRE